jgi:hypothetical protein
METIALCISVLRAILLLHVNHFIGFQINAALFILVIKLSTLDTIVYSSGLYFIQVRTKDQTIISQKLQLINEN